LADTTTWGKALVEPLPNAPDLQIYCMYGVGVDTERSYTLTSDKRIDHSVDSKEYKIEKGVQYSDGGETMADSSSASLPLSLPSSLSLSLSDLI